MGVEAWFLSWHWFEDNRVICRKQPELWHSSFKTNDLPRLSALTVYSSNLMLLIYMKISIILFLFFFCSCYPLFVALNKLFGCSHGNCTFWTGFRCICDSWEPVTWQLHRDFWCHQIVSSVPVSDAGVMNFRFSNSKK